MFKTLIIIRKDCRVYSKQDFINFFNKMQFSWVMLSVSNKDLCCILNYSVEKAPICKWLHKTHPASHQSNNPFTSQGRRNWIKIMNVVFIAKSPTEYSYYAASECAIKSNGLVWNKQTIKTLVLWTVATMARKTVKNLNYENRRKMFLSAGTFFLWQLLSILYYIYLHAMLQLTTTYYSWRLIVL